MCKWWSTLSRCLPSTECLSMSIFTVLLLFVCLFVSKKIVSFHPGNVVKWGAALHYGRQEMPDWGLVNLSDVSSIFESVKIITRAATTAASPTPTPLAHVEEVQVLWIAGVRRTFCIIHLLIINLSISESISEIRKYCWRCFLSDRKWT